MFLEPFMPFDLTHNNLPALSNILIVTSSSLPPTQSVDELTVGLGLKRISSELKMVSSYVPWHSLSPTTLIKFSPLSRVSINSESEVV